MFVWTASTQTAFADDTWIPQIFEMQYLHE